MKKPTKGSYTKNPKYKIIMPNGDIKILRGVGRGDDGSIISEYQYFEFPKSAGKKALEKKQQEKMKKSSGIKKSSSKKK
jgi:hypothetical protein